MLLGNYRLDQWLLGAIAGSRELGLYSVAVAWAEALWFLPTTLSAVQRPDLVRAAKREAARLSTLIFRAAMVLTLVAAAAMLLLAPFLCVTIFGEEFRGSIIDLRVLVLGSLRRRGAQAARQRADRSGSPGPREHGDRSRASPRLSSSM